MGTVNLTGEIGKNIVPLTTKEFKRIVHKYFKLSRVFVYKFTRPAGVSIHIHIYFCGKLNTDITEELRSYVPLGCTFVFQHINIFNFIYGRKYGFFFAKKKRLSKEECERTREQVVEDIRNDQDQSEWGRKQGRGPSQGERDVRPEINGQETDHGDGGYVGEDLQPGVPEGDGTGPDS